MALRDAGCDGDDLLSHSRSERRTSADAGRAALSSGRNKPIRQTKCDGQPVMFILALSSAELAGANDGRRPAGYDPLPFSTELTEPR